MKKILLIAIILLVLIPYFTQASSEKNDEEILLSIMDDLDGKLLETDIGASEKIIDSFLSLSQLDKIGQDLLKPMGMIGEEGKVSSEEIEEAYFIKEVIQDEGYNQLSYFGYDNKRNPLTIILTSYINMDQKGETYLYINTLKKASESLNHPLDKKYLLLNKMGIFDENNDIIDKVKNIYLKFNKEVNVTTCLIGEKSGKFSDEEIYKLRNSMLNLNGKIVDEYKDENLISLTGFTNYIDNNILAGDDRINLNVALTYYEYDNKTIIWIGTPIITSGY